MTNNSLKRNQAEDHQNTTDTKKRKVKEVHQKASTCKNVKSLSFLEVCKKKSSKCYKVKRFSQKGNDMF